MCIHTRSRLCLLLVAMACLWAERALGQDHCWIRYRYDDAGNRIKREWWCGDPHQAEGEVKMRAPASFGLSLGPVPAKDELILRSEEALENAELEITDLQGRPVLRRSVTGSSIPITVGTWANGTYSLRLRTLADEYLYTFIVSH